MNTHNKIPLFLVLMFVFQVTEAKQYMFRDFFDQLEEEMMYSINNISHALPGLQKPIQELDETTEAFIVRMAVPGLSKENIEIIVDDLSEGALLTVRAQVKEENEEADEEKTYRKSAVYQQSFSQQMRLSQPVVVEAIQADLKDGVLTITLPKATPVKRHSHTIKVK